MTPLPSDGMTATMTSIMTAITAGIRKNAAFFMTCLIEKPIERIEYAGRFI
jgi:hypothetical protein